MRISPFDSNKRQHTSFASVDVVTGWRMKVILKSTQVKCAWTPTAAAKGAKCQQGGDSSASRTFLRALTRQPDPAKPTSKPRHGHKLLLAKLYAKRGRKKSEMERFYSDKGAIG